MLKFECDINDGGEDHFNQLQQIFLTQINNNNIDWIKSFLNNPSTSSLYSQFKYPIEKNYLPNKDCHVTPIIIAILNNKLSIVRLLIQHQQQQHQSPRYLHNPNEDSLIATTNPSITTTILTTTTATITATPPTNSLMTTVFNPTTYKEHGIPLFFYAIASESIEMMDYILSLYSTSIITPTTESTQSNEISLPESTPSSSSTSSKPSTPSTTTSIDTILSDSDSCLNPLQFSAQHLKIEQVKYLIEQYQSNPLLIHENGSSIFHFATNSKDDSIAIIEYLLTLNGVKDLLEHQNVKGSTPLSVSAKSNNYNIFKYLIEKCNVSTSIVTSNGFNVLHSILTNSSSQIDFIDYIINLQPTFITSRANDGSTPLHFAILYNTTQIVKHLIEQHHADPLLISIQYNQTVLHLALTSKVSSVEKMEYLLSVPDVKDLLEYKDIDGFTPLSLAVQNNCYDVFKLLVQKYNADMNTIINSGHNLLHLATSSTSLVPLTFIDEIITLNPTIINSVDNDGLTPLWYAIEGNNLELTQHLIQHNANPLYIDPENNTSILHAAATSTVDSIEMFEYLLSLDGVKDLLEHQCQARFTPLLILASRQKPNSFKYLIEEHNANILCQDRDGETVAHLFSWHGNIEMIDFIHNINPNLIHQLDDDGYSPLLFAILNNSLSLVTCLITQYDADFNGVTNYGKSVLHFATKKGSIELVDYIIGLNSTFVELTDHDGQTPLFAASCDGNIDIFHHLINQYNANPFVLDRYNFNIMHRAATSKNAQIIKSIATIFQNSQPPTTLQFTLPNGYPRLTGEWFDDLISPLHYAIQQSKLDAVKQLVRLKANITTTNTISKFNPNFSTILQYSYHVARKKNNYSIFKYLLSDKCLKDWNSEKELKFNDETTITIYGQKDPIPAQLDINYSDEHYTLLLYAASNGDFRAIKLLIERKANIYTVDDEDRNILHSLILTVPTNQQSQDKLLNIINYLFSLPTIDGSKLLSQQTSSYGQTPLLLAAQQCSFPIVQQLIHLKADINFTVNNNSIVHYASLNSFSIIIDFIHHYPQLFKDVLYQHNDTNGYTPFHISISTKCPIQQQNDDDDDGDDDTDGEDDDGKDGDDVEYNLYNPDITTFIQYDPTLLLQTTTSKATILHVAVQAENELPTRLAGLIESLIDHIDSIV